jgi:hypothetical protein
MRYLPLLCIPLFLCGCVTTNFYSRLNPDCAGLQYQRILVQFADQEPGFSTFGEKALKDVISKNIGPNIQCYLYSDEFYTGYKPRAEMKADVQNFLAGKKIDALLICISVQDLKKQTNTMYNAATGMTSSYNNDQKVAGYRMELFDLRTGKSVWYSTAKMEGLSLLNSYQGMMKSFLEKAVLDMKSNFLLGVDDRPFIPYGTGPNGELPKPKQEI